MFVLTRKVEDGEKRGEECELILKRDVPEKIVVIAQNPRTI